MARIVDCCPSSGDELPELDMLITQARSKSTRPPRTVLSSPEKVLVPKDTSKSTTRKMRRLGGGSHQNINPLFQRWTLEDHKSSKANEGAPVTEPRVKAREVRARAEKEAAKSRSHPDNHEDESEDGTEDAPQFCIRKARSRRPVVISDSDDSDDSGVSDEESLHARIRALRLAREQTKLQSSVRSLPSQSNAFDEQDEDEDDAVERQLREEVSYRKEVDRASATESSRKCEGHRDDDYDEEASAFSTASKKSSDYTEDSESDFELEDSFDGVNQMPSPKPFGRPKQPSTTDTKFSITRTAPSLQPQGSNMRNREHRAREKETASKSAASVDESGSQSRAKPHGGDGSRKSKAKSTTADLADSLAKLRLQLQDFSDDEKPSTQKAFAATPGTPPRTSKAKGLSSPSKHDLIPKTPHRPSTDAFWDQEVVNGWNDEYSPRKLILPPISKTPAKASPTKEPKRETKKAFGARKHAVAESFLAELDGEITEGKIADLAASTGGVKLVWTKTLNTTAGRANWRRETIRTKKSDGTQVDIQYKHHASIELAEKVIDDEHRLLNVLAHEFCHLANFMVSGITTNPHGREFKMWAAKCSHAFGDRGIEVTTKHSYEIDFKFVWECTACGTEFKRHSRSIDPQRHRCGSCKSLLKQTKPVPRKNNTGASSSASATTTTTARQPSRYQIFVKEQMRIVREENPGSPQKDVMRLIADKWAKERDAPKQKEDKKNDDKLAKLAVDGVAEGMTDLTLEVEA